MQESTILFSIIIPTYNRANLIEKAIKSVLAQTFTDWELIIVDDGSTDATAEVVKIYEDDRIKYFWKENEERGAARNFGVNQSEGEYICFLDSDDFYLPNHLANLVELILKTNAVFFQTSYQARDFADNILIERIMPAEVSINDMAHSNFFAINGACMAKSVVLQFPFPADPLFSIGEDHYFWFKLLSRYRVYTSPIVTSVVREHPKKTMNTLDPDRVIYCAKKLQELLKDDVVFHQTCPMGLSVVTANFYSTAAYFSFRNGKKQKGFRLFWEALKIRPKEFFKSRTLSIVYRFFKPI